MVPIYTLASRGDLDGIKEAMKTTDVRDPFVGMAVCCAAEKGQLDVLKYFHEIGANMHVNLDYPFRALCNFGFLEHAKQFYANIPDIDVHSLDDTVYKYTYKDHPDIYEWLCSIDDPPADLSFAKAVVIAVGEQDNITLRTTTEKIYDFIYW